MSFHIIGDQDTVLGYRFAGISGDAVEDAAHARDAFEAAVKSKRFKILVLTRPVEAMLHQQVLDHRLNSEPPFVVVVDDIWSTRTESKDLEELIYEAVGIRISKSTE